MSEKVLLGFWDKDAEYKSFYADKEGKEYWRKAGEKFFDKDGVITEFTIPTKKLVPVVSLEEHKEFLDAGKLLKLRVIELELEVKRLKAAARREAKK